jgi:HPt (histidine-containing phosphotransfer) domain-containing protein
MLEADGPILDEGVLTELRESTGGDIGFVRELIETYLADTPVQLDAMTAAVEADDAEALVRPAHTLKSSSATVGAMRLSSVARELEMVGRTGSLEASVRERLDSARAEWTTAQEAFAAWLQEASAE